ncbi:type VII secretion-associated serine protease mycosin [Microtetraspora sp. NBRC 16547]|uniref:type VII secretion-associated serine protease mycosin n=1 Tax=Microtetraspora sp. NBRC 16547 TaxID=3030993 RepID=UPI0024A1FF69|nr:type VII secretion-associated serine protease mycosin [Microtetraspora sp. NBRC 16547]GLW96138.1 peptidase S8 [Microtetraspora sp. NBRC 16547]
MRRLAAITPVLSMLLPIALITPPASADAAKKDTCAPSRPGSLTLSEPWAQRRLDFTSVWPLTRGRGVTVAIVDSGVDARHPQLKVARSVDLTGTGTQDCMGHGTSVAGIIAATERKGSPFAGVAPDARLISIKQTNAERGDPALLARAIAKAADLGAQVINVSVKAVDRMDLRRAVGYALSKDAVIVAAAGNVTKDDGTPSPAYPAAYPGVLAVGSSTPDDELAEFSNTSTPVAVLAPGQDLTSTWPGGTYQNDLKGTSHATAYVSGVVALVRARYPELDNVRVRRRVVLTADGTKGTGTGAGIVNPRLAVTMILPSEVVAVAPQEPASLSDDAILKADPPDEHAIGVAAIVAGGALGAAALTVVATVVLPLGRRRRWRPGEAN